MNGKKRMISIIGITLIGAGAIITYALCKAAAIESRLEEQDEVSRLQQELYNLIDTKGLDSQEVLVLSQRLDRAVLKRMKEINANEKR